MRLYDDYTELRPGAAKELEESLNAPIRKTAGYEPTDNTRPPSSVLQGINEPNSSGQPNQHQKSRYHHAPTSLETQTQQAGGSPSVITIGPEGRWLLICTELPRKPPILRQHDVCLVKSDRDIFSDLKRLYYDMKSHFSQHLSLKSVSSIRFVQVSSAEQPHKTEFTDVVIKLQKFELHINNFVDVRKVPDIPPETKKDGYSYQACDLVPPVGERLMTHLFHHPECANNEQPVAFLRTPKKKNEKLAVSPQIGTRVGWGIQIIEGWIVGRLWLLAFTFVVLGTTVFAICWSVLEKDLQGAFAVSAYAVTVVGLITGTIQTHLC